MNLKQAKTQKYMLELAVLNESLYGAWRIILSKRERLNIRLKSSFGSRSEVVTDLDIIINQFIGEKILEAFPRDVVIGEEGAYNFANSADRFWLVDPIDGTRSFIKNTRGSSVMVALVQDRQPVLSGVLDISTGVTVIAGPFGTSVQGPSSETDDFLSRSSRKKATLGERGVVISNPFSKINLASGIYSNLKSLMIESTGLRAIELCKHKSGFFVSRPNSSKIWDTAPAQVLLDLYGANYTDLNGNRLQYQPSQKVNQMGAVASIGIDHNELLYQLGKMQSFKI